MGSLDPVATAPGTDTSRYKSAVKPAHSKKEILIEIRRHSFPRLQLRSRCLSRDLETRGPAGRFYLAPRDGPFFIRCGDNSRRVLLRRLSARGRAGAFLAGDEFIERVRRQRKSRPRYLQWFSDSVRSGLAAGSFDP